VYLEYAGALGAALGTTGIGLVYGGSASGAMGILATAAMRAGGPVIGVIPRHLLRHEPLKLDITKYHVVDTMHERKSLIYQLSDSFIALPGGFVTFDELFETLTWSKLGLHRKPVVLLNVDGYFDTLLGLLDHAVAEGFITPGDRALVCTVDTVSAALHTVAPRTAAVS
jgi:uncharacterized protein (TIGR00730 family)